MAESRPYELQSLDRAKDYEEVPYTPSRDDLLVPSRRLSQSPPPIFKPRASSYVLLDAVNAGRSLLLPLVAAAYLAFCYTVHNKTVPLKSTLFDTSPENLGRYRSLM